MRLGTSRWMYRNCERGQTTTRMELPRGNRVSYRQWHPRRERRGFGVLRSQMTHRSRKNRITMISGEGRGIWLAQKCAPFDSCRQTIKRSKNWGGVASTCDLVRARADLGEFCIVLSNDHRFTWWPWLFWCKTTVWLYELALLGFFGIQMRRHSETGVHTWLDCGKLYESTGINIILCWYFSPVIFYWLPSFNCTLISIIELWTTWLSRICSRGTLDQILNSKENRSLDFWTIFRRNTEVFKSDDNLRPIKYIDTLSNAISS